MYYKDGVKTLAWFRDLFPCPHNLLDFITEENFYFLSLLVTFFFQVSIVQKILLFFIRNTS